MALLLLDGFDYYSTAQVTRRWNLSGTTSAVYVAVDGTVTPHTYGQCLRINTTGGNRAGGIQQTLPPKATFIIGFAFYAAANPAVNTAIVGLLDGTTVQCSLVMATDGTVTVRRGGYNGTVLATIGVFPTSTWKYIEWKVTIDNANGISIVKYDEVEQSNINTQDTQSTTNASAHALMVGDNFQANVDFRYDDLYVCDDQGGVNNDFLGRCRVLSLRPSSAGDNTNFTPSAGANWDAVEESPPTDDTDYVQSGTTNHRDSYNYQDEGAIYPTSIKGVALDTVHKKLDVGPRSWKSTLRISATDYDSAEADATLIYRDTQHIWDVSPATAAAFTRAEVNGMQAGIKVQS